MTPRCDSGAESFLEDILTQVDKLAEAAAAEMETRVPADKWEAGWRLQVLMDFALSVEFTAESLARVALAPPPSRPPSQEAA